MSAILSNSSFEHNFCVNLCNYRGKGTEYVMRYPLVKKYVAYMPQVEVVKDKIKLIFQKRRIKIKEWFASQELCKVCTRLLQ